MAAFYLLLTTGMYVCFVSCGSNHIRELLSAVATHEKHHESSGQACHKGEKNCKGDKDCDCCKKHGNYTVKENIKPECDFLHLEVPVIAETTFYFDFLNNQTIIITSVTLPKSNAPPPGITSPIFIKVRSLLI